MRSRRTRSSGRGRGSGSRAEPAGLRAGAQPNRHSRDGAVTRRGPCRLRRRGHLGCGENGADGTRTRALLAASQSLSQLSYGPLLPSKCSREVEVVCPIYPPPLIVPARAKPKHDRWSALHAFDWDEEASIQVEAVSRDRVDLGSRVSAPNKALCATACALTTDHQDFVAACGPLALHTHKAIFVVEDHVVPPTHPQRQADTRRFRAWLLRIEWPARQSLRSDPLSQETT